MKKDFLESLERLAMPDDLHIKECKKLGIGLTEDYDLLKQAILELTSIKKAEPSKALEELKRIDYNITYLLSDCDSNEEVSMNFNSIRDNKSCEIIKQYILKAQEEHKLLEIIKEKVMNLVSISDGRVWDGELYQSNKLTEEETVILNRWKNE